MLRFVPIVLVTLTAASALALDYAEDSTGLVPPDFDGGRTELEMADVNLDGRVDLVSIGDHGSPYINTDQHGIMVWRGTADGGWSLVMTGNFGYGGVTIGDVNGDGLPDAGDAMHHDYSGTDFGDQLIEVALGDGTGTAWTPWDDGLATGGESWGMFGTDFADVDNDGAPDFAAAHQFGTVYRGDGAGGWTEAASFVTASPGHCQAFRVGDVARIDIDLSTSGPGGPWTRLATGLPDNGAWQWTVAGPAATTAHLRSTATTASETDVATTGSFTILGGTTAVPPSSATPPLVAAPNPFNPVTVIAYALAAPEPVTLTIHDLAGRRVATLLTAERRPAGDHAITWDGRDDHGRALPAGAYVCRLQTGAGQRSLTLTLLK